MLINGLFAYAQFFGNIVHGCFMETMQHEMRFAEL
jgi:hypothetical protein